MYFQQFYLSCLSHASYLIGSGGVAAVVDPQRDAGIYVEDAVKNGFQIQHVIETHLHADFVSGHRELAELTGARIYLGAAGGAKFPHVPVRDGDEIRFGDCILRFLETPGHTVESISVLVTDTTKSQEPFAVLTGDTLFIGDVGRPDLSGDYTPQQLAAQLYDSLHGKLLRLADEVEIYPAHGAGSLCGRQLSAERCSTIGKQRLSNYALQPKSKEEFVRLLTAELPERPGYFALDAEINRSGATPLADLPIPDALAAREVAARQREGILVLDTRAAAQFGGAHIPGAIHIALSGQYASWAARLIGLNGRIILVAEDHDAMLESRVRLARVGMEDVIGCLEDGMASWFREGLPVEQTPQITVQDLHGELSADEGHIQVVDVRQPAEWEQGHIREAVLKPLPKLTAMLEGLDPSRPIAVHCKSGYRSSIASSLLTRAGMRDVMNVIGGFDAWQACNLPFVTP